MTLVVARKLERFLRIVSDTKITDERESRPRPLDGALKAVIIDQALCVCYAGDAEVGKDAIQRVHKERVAGVQLESIYSYLADESRNGSGAGVEFIVVRGHPEPEIRKIAAGLIDPPSAAEHIGDDEAFGAFQKAMASQPNHEDLPFGLRELSKMSGALDSVIGDNRLPGVGGFGIVIGLSPSGFEYHPKFASHSAKFGEEAQQDISGPEPKTLRLVDSAASGGYTFNICVPAEPGIGALGIYFNQDRLGALYFPAKLRHVKVYTGVGSREFVQKVQQDFGFELLEAGFEQQ